MDGAQQFIINAVSCINAPQFAQYGDKLVAQCFEYSRIALNYDFFAGEPPRNVVLFG